jgi:2-keto-4-pentenoate hydratase
MVPPAAYSLKCAEAPIASADVPQARVEAEVALVMGADIEGFPRTPETTLAAVGYALPAIEVVSCRISGWDVSAFDFVADNAAAALVVLGTARLEIPRCDWAKLSMTMDINGHRRASSSGAVYEESPVCALHWLALQLAARNEPLRRGDVVMSGSIGPAIPVEAGDRVQVRLGSQPPVDAHFV